jgi:hypothetical protein
LQQLSKKFGMLSAGNFEQLKKMCHTKICFLTQIFKLKTEIDMHKNMVVKSFNKKVLNFKKA